MYYNTGASLDGYTEMEVTELNFSFSFEEITFGLSFVYFQNSFETVFVISHHDTYRYCATNILKCQCRLKCMSVCATLLAIFCDTLQQQTSITLVSLIVRYDSSLVRERMVRLLCHALF